MTDETAFEAFKRHIKEHPGRQHTYTPFGWFEAGWNVAQQARQAALDVVYAIDDRVIGIRRGRDA
ncbi:MAG: hypothetical protein AB7R89_28340 [Dehalococcoidia bacterium]